MAYLDNPFLVPDDHPVPWTLHIQEEVLVRRQRHEIRFQRLDDGMQPKRNRIDLFLSALQPKNPNKVFSMASMCPATRRIVRLYSFRLDIFSPS